MESDETKGDIMILQQSLDSDTRKYLLGLNDKSLRLLLQDIIYNEFVTNCLLSDNLKNIVFDLPVEYLQGALQKTLNTNGILAFPALKDKIMNLEGRDSVLFFQNLYGLISTSSYTQGIMKHFSTYDLRLIIQSLSANQLDYLKLLLSYYPEGKLQPFFVSLREKFTIIQRGSYVGVL